VLLSVAAVLSDIRNKSAFVTMTGPFVADFGLNELCTAAAIF